MSFGSTVKEYLKNADCNASMLCNVTGLNASQVSRYLNDKRKPRAESEAFEKICKGLCELDSNLNFDEVHRALLISINGSGSAREEFTGNFNLLISELGISTTALANALNYDASFISRIKNGTRYPSNYGEFCENVGRYVAFHCSPVQIMSLAGLLDSDAKLLENKAYCAKSVAAFLGGTFKSSNEPIEKFLKAIDKSVKAGGIEIPKAKLPSSPIHFGKDKYYYGIEGMQKAEKDFFKLTILSQAKRNVFIHSEMGMEEVDEAQQKQLVNAVLMLLSKGIGIDIIHNLDRNLEEMLLGIEVWIPFYLTGMINSYYMKKPATAMFPQILCTSGSIIMHGECIGSDQSKMLSYTTTNKKLLPYFYEKQEKMLQNANPLIKTYSENDEESFKSFISQYSENLTNAGTDKFENIDFTICGDKFISVNKISTPHMHFVIFNKQLNKAILKFLELE